MFLMILTANITHKWSWETTKVNDVWCFLNGFPCFCRVYSVFYGAFVVCIFVLYVWMIRVISSVVFFLSLAQQWLNHVIVWGCISSWPCRNPEVSTTKITPHKSLIHSCRGHRPTLNETLPKITQLSFTHSPISSPPIPSFHQEASPLPTHCVWFWMLIWDKDDSLWSQC